MIGNEAQNW